MWKILSVLLPFALAGEPLTCLMNDDDHICMRSTNVTHPDQNGAVEPCEVETHTCLSLVFDGNYTQGAGCVSKADASVGGTCSYLQQYAGYIGRDIQCSYCDTNDCNTCNIPPEDLLSCQQDIDHDLGFGFDDNRAICKGTTITTLNFPCFRNTSHCVSADFGGISTTGYGCIPKIDNDDTKWTCNVIQDWDPRITSCLYCGDEEDCNECTNLYDAMSLSGFLWAFSSGLISTCSSFLILFVIAKSEQKLSTTYHRIMASLSSYDILISVAGGLSTVLLPKDYITEMERFKYHDLNFPVEGTMETCHAQGWLILFGWIGTSGSTLLLCFYYVLVCLRVQETTIRKFVEPICYLVTFISSIIAASLVLKQNVININDELPYCLFGTFPQFCYTNPNIECEIDFPDIGKVVKSFFTLNAAVLGLMSLSMIFIVFTVFQSEQRLNAIRSSDQENKEQNGIQQKSETRSIVVQALMYVLGYGFTWVPLMVQAFSGNGSRHAFRGFALFCIGLQGFWNALIFLYHKVLLVRRSNKDISRFEAFKRVLSSPAEVPNLILSDIDNVVISDRGTNEIEVPSFEDSADVSMSKAPNSKLSSASAYEGLSFSTPSALSISDSNAQDSREVYANANGRAVLERKDSKFYPDVVEEVFADDHTDGKSASGLSFGGLFATSFTGMSFDKSAANNSVVNDGKSNEKSTDVSNTSS